MHNKDSCKTSNVVRCIDMGSEESNKSSWMWRK